MSHEDEADELRTMERLAGAIGDHMAGAAAGDADGWRTATSALVAGLDSALKSIRNLRVSAFGPRGADRTIARAAGDALVEIVVEVQELRRRLIDG
jgi:hypothetical protein